ncbi:MAG: HipA domain-containing protein [Burkholderiales bacterium]|nr:HipA domain-containing protein [Burkholderiales bacterium]
MSAYQVTDELWLWWLIDPAHPRLVGTLRHVRRSARQPGGVSLEYAPPWLASGQALSEDLPLLPGEFLPADADAAAGAVDDARPDRWGERVVRLLDRPARLSTLEYLYFSGDDRFGALGVSASPAVYLPRDRGPLPAIGDVQAVHDLVRRVEAGEPVEEPLRRLVAPGATLGGARPKALLAIDGVPWIVKFDEAGAPTDSPLVEHAAMTLAAKAGIDVCTTIPLRLTHGHAVAVQRFDRSGPLRVYALSAHVALRAAGQEYGYPELALLLRRRGEADGFVQQGEQLFRRLVFNILIDNTDDHEKNHALIVSATQRYRLSPAFDVLPAGQALGYQQMRVGRDGADATLVNALSEHRSFALTNASAKAVAAEVARAVAGWRAHFAEKGVSPRDIDLLAEQIDRPFLREQRVAEG